MLRGLQSRIISTMKDIPEDPRDVFKFFGIEDSWPKYHDATRPGSTKKSVIKRGRSMNGSQRNELARCTLGAGSRCHRSNSS